MYKVILIIILIAIVIHNNAYVTIYAQSAY